jgi:glycosyltransferase involved in cell wall biosynthesis
LNSTKKCETSGKERVKYLVVRNETQGPHSPFELSVVIPIGGIGNDFSKLKLNLLAATQHHFEVVLVLDGLQNSQRDQIKTFVKSKNLESKNISFHETNFQNPGAARNFGLNLASGKFIAFWDSDDLADCAKIAQCLAEVRDQTDAVIGAFQQTHLGNSSSRTFRPHRLSWRLDLFVRPGFWRILYRRDRLGSAEFGVSRMGEDQVFLASFGIWERKVEISDEVFYTYFTGNPNQLTQALNRFKQLRLTINELKLLNHNQNFLNKLFISLLVIKLNFSLFKSKICGKDIH